MCAAIENSMLSVEFLLAGKAVFTVSNGKGQRYTYRLRKAKTGGKVWFASLLTGPDNTANYTYLGIVDAGLKFRLTEKSKMVEDSTPVRVLSWALRLVATRKGLPDGYAMHHEGRCGRCGRVLTVPESIEMGLGPECAGKMEM